MPSNQSFTTPFDQPSRTLSSRIQEHLLILISHPRHYPINLLGHHLASVLGHHHTSLQIPSELPSSTPSNQSSGTPSDQTSRSLLDHPSNNLWCQPISLVEPLQTSHLEPHQINLPTLTPINFHGYHLISRSNTLFTTSIPSVQFPVPHSNSFPQKCQLPLFFIVIFPYCYFLSFSIFLFSFTTLPTPVSLHQF
jgi:hypothetical protein